MITNRLSEGDISHLVSHRVSKRGHPIYFEGVLKHL